MNKIHSIIQNIKNVFDNKEFIPLHEPIFRGNEKKFLLEFHKQKPLVNHSDLLFTSIDKKSNKHFLIKFKKYTVLLMHTSQFTPVNFAIII